MLLVRFANDESNSTLRKHRPQILLQLRGYGTQSGGTWAVPGGALDHGETPTAGALRETSEEACLPRDCTTRPAATTRRKKNKTRRKSGGSGTAPSEEPLVVLRDELVTMDHGSWKYTTVVAELRDPGAWKPRIPKGDVESLELEWVAVEEVEGRTLHPGFGASWPMLRQRIERLDRERGGGGEDDGDGESG